MARIFTTHEIITTSNQLREMIEKAETRASKDIIFKADLLDELVAINLLVEFGEIVAASAIIGDFPMKILTFAAGGKNLTLSCAAREAAFRKRLSDIKKAR
jgi:hypothetical protein